MQFNASALLIATVLGLGTALIAGYWPARTAGKTSPLEALRPATTASIHRAARWSLIAGVVVMVLAVVLLISGSKGAVGGALLFLIGMVIAAPGLVIPVARLFSPLLTLWFAREGDLARGNLVRQPGRAAITGSTLMIGLAVLMLMAAVVISLRRPDPKSGERQFLQRYSAAAPVDCRIRQRDRRGLRVGGPGAGAAGSRYRWHAALRLGSVSNGQSLEVLGIDPNDLSESRVARIQPGRSRHGVRGAGKRAQRDPDLAGDVFAQA